MSQPTADFDKKSFLDRLLYLLQTGEISKTEVLQVVKNAQNSSDTNHLIVKTFAILGSIITILGIVFLTGLLWTSMNDFAQIFITLGVGVSAFLAGIFLVLNNFPRFIARAIHLIGIFLIPIGVFVTLSKLPSSTIPDSFVIFVVFILMALIYLMTDFYLKSRLFTIAVYCFASISYFALVSLFFESINVFEGFRIFNLFTLVYTIPLIFMPRIFPNDFRIGVYHFFEGLGYLILFVLVFGMLFDTIFEILAITVYITGAVLGSWLKSQTMIIYSFIAITLFILYINFRYFANIITWPISLILSGFVLLASSYLFSKVRSDILLKK